MLTRKILVLATAMPAVLLQSAAYAEEVAVWKGGAEAGIVATNGNTNTQTINAKLDVTKDKTKLRHNAKLEALNTSDDETTTAESYLGSWQTDYKLSGDNYLFGNAKYVDDRFTGFDYQSTLAGGYGRQVVKSEKNSLFLEVGAGVLTTKSPEINPNPNDDPSGTESSAIVQLNAKYNHKLSETASFSQTINIDAGDNTVAKSVSAISAQIMGKLSMKVSYTVRTTTSVPVGTDSTDSETALTLVYSI